MLLTNSKNLWKMATTYTPEEVYAALSQHIQNKLLRDKIMLSLINFESSQNKPKSRPVNRSTESMMEIIIRAVEISVGRGISRNDMFAYGKQSFPVTQCRDIVFKICDVLNIHHEYATQYLSRYRSYPYSKNTIPSAVKRFDIRVKIETEIKNKFDIAYRTFLQLQKSQNAG